MKKIKQLSIYWVINLLSILTPSIIIIIGLPYIKKEISESDFLEFILAFSLISIFSTLDAGLGRSTTYFVSNAIASGSKEEHHYLAASLIIGTFFSLLIITSVVLFIGADFYLSRNNSLLYIINYIWLLPIFIVSALVKGYLEAEQKFLQVSFIQLVFGLTLIISPIISITFTDSITTFPYIIGLIRLAFSLILVKKISKNKYYFYIKIKQKMHDVYLYSKWLIISNIIGIAIVFFDRTIVSYYFDQQTVSDYFTSMELILKSQIIISTAIAILFPIITSKLRNNLNLSTLIKLYKLAIIMQLFIFLIAIASIYGLNPYINLILSIWIDEIFAQRTSNIIFIGMIGFIFSSSSALIMMIINSYGETKKIAISHIIQLPIYALILYWAGNSNNILIVAIIWLIRLIFDWLVMNIILHQDLNRKYNELLNQK